MNYNCSLYSPYIKNIISQKKKIVKPGEILSIFTIFFLRWQKLDRTFVCLMFFMKTLNDLNSHGKVICPGNALFWV